MKLGNVFQLRFILEKNIVNLRKLFFPIISVNLRLFSVYFITLAVELVHLDLHALDLLLKDFKCKKILCNGQ
jgi:hypothetical protein